MNNELKWSRERSYISNMVEVARGLRAPDANHNMRDFNYRREVLIKYLEMQSEAAGRDGRHDTVVYIEHCLDDLREFIAKVASA